MIKKLLLLTGGLIFTLYTAQNTGIQKSKFSKDASKTLELVLSDPKENFIWKKGEFLYLKATLTNKSQVPITVLKPKISSKINPDYFSVNFIQGRKLNFEGINEKTVSRATEDFITILPDQTIELYISGDAYLTQYYREETSDEDEIKLNLIYNIDRETPKYTSDSYFILQNYRTKLTKDEEIELQKEIKALSTSPSVESKKVEEQKKYLENYEKNYKSNIINTAPEELKLIIEKFNSMYANKIESNTITIKIEK